MEIKILLLKVLTELSVTKGSVELLQKEIRRLKVGVSAVNTQYEANIGIEIPLKIVSYSLEK
jgi:hypothetical protein